MLKNYAFHFKIKFNKKNIYHNYILILGFLICVKITTLNLLPQKHGEWKRQRAPKSGNIEGVHAKKSNPFKVTTTMYDDPSMH